jgi:D-alanyl-D-alanine carboxypeptidase
LGKGSENAYNLLELNSKSVTILHHSDEITKNIFSINEKERVEIASITKIMTCYLILIIAERFCIDIKKEKLIVSERASKMPGTSAKLAYSDMLTVYDILHGLMLPSGNDAAISLG